ncbi:hypothetical protein PFISCL1PPCAC_8563, partial [Pristionchus fissidentatus]
RERERERKPVYSFRALTFLGIPSLVRAPPYHSPCIFFDMSGRMKISCRFIFHGASWNKIHTFSYAVLFATFHAVLAWERIVFCGIIAFLFATYHVLSAIYTIRAGSGEVDLINLTHVCLFSVLAILLFVNAQQTVEKFREEMRKDEEEKLRFHPMKNATGIRFV